MSTLGHILLTQAAGPAYHQCGASCAINMNEDIYSTSGNASTYIPQQVCAHSFRHCLTVLHLRFVCFSSYKDKDKDTHTHTHTHTVCVNLVHQAYFSGVCVKGVLGQTK